MKNNKKINLILILLIPLVFVGLLVFNKDTPITAGEKRILVEKSYSNYAWGYQYYGSAICSDGTIYTWDLSNGDYQMTSYDSLEDESFELIKSASPKITKVSKKDMERLKEAINNLNGYMSRKNVAMDAGSNTITVWNYTIDNTIVIKESGDYVGENESPEAQEIIRIVNKYL